MSKSPVEVKDALEIIVKELLQKLQGKGWKAKGQVNVILSSKANVDVKEGDVDLSFVEQHLGELKLSEVKIDLTVSKNYTK